MKRSEAQRSDLSAESPGTVLFCTDTFWDDRGDQVVAADPTVEVVRLVGDGEVIASKTYSMPPATPIFLSTSDLAPSFDNGTLRLTMTEGEAIFGGSVNPTVPTVGR